MTKDRKIAFVIGSMSNGGAERVISIIANHYANLGWTVDILMLLSNNCSYQIDSRINLVDLSGRKSSRITMVPSWINRLRNYAKKQKPDIIVSFVARINILTQIALRNLDIPIIVSERNDPYMDGRGFLVDIFTKWLYPKASHVVFQTKRAQGYFPTLNNSCIISNPVEIHADKKEVLKNRIVSVGRLSEQKNQRLLITAFAQVHKKYPEYVLDIYGEGHLRDSLQQLISDLGVEDYVSLKGNVQDIHNEISDAKLFVLSSDYEGLSNALLEAMMMGIPCISTNCAGSDEYIEHGENGLLVEVGNLSAMADAIEYMITHVEEATHMGTCAKHTSQTFEKSNVIKQWDNIINISIN